MTYSEKLKDPRWKARRLTIIQLANYRCEDCGEPRKEDSWFEVHHCFYAVGRDPWDYGSDLLICLCPECHEFRQGREQAAQIVFSQFMRKMPRRQLENAVWEFLLTTIPTPWNRLHE